jgi:hypothetical protein
LDKYPKQQLFPSSWHLVPLQRTKPAVFWEKIKITKIKQGGCVMDLKKKAKFWARVSNISFMVAVAFVFRVITVMLFNGSIEKIFVRMGITLGLAMTFFCISLYSLGVYEKKYKTFNVRSWNGNWEWISGFILFVAFFVEMAIRLDPNLITTPPKDTKIYVKEYDGVVNDAGLWDLGNWSTRVIVSEPKSSTICFRGEMGLEGGEVAFLVSGVQTQSGLCTPGKRKVWFITIGDQRFFYAGGQDAQRIRSFVYGSLVPSPL